MNYCWENKARNCYWIKCLLGTTVPLLPSVAVSLYRVDPIFHTLGFQGGHFIPWINSEKFKNIHARGRNEQLGGGHRKGLWAFRLHIPVLQTSRVWRLYWTSIWYNGEAALCDVHAAYGTGTSPSLPIQSHTPNTVTKQVRNKHWQVRRPPPVQEA